MFPHHENEIAIARAAGGSFARVWMHCHPVQYDGSLDTDDARSLTLDRLVDMGWDEKTIRFWLLSAHYRKSLLLSRKSLDDAQTVLSRINRCIESLGHVSGQSNEEDIQQITYDLRQGMMDAMASDLKIPVLVSGLLSGVKRINRLVVDGQIGPGGAERLLNCFKDVDVVLNIFDFSRKVAYSSEVSALMAERDAARQQKDFKTADRIREQLDEMGILVHDQKV
jgi:cysteinyl-tRNA synthetase